MEYICVKNWKRYQHYTKRKPPWIKLYRDLLRDREFSALPDACKWHSVGLLLLAAYHENKIPYDVPYIRREINAKSRIDFTRIFDSGLLTICRQGPSVRQIPEPDGEAETDVEYQIPEPRAGNRGAPSHYARMVFDILSIKDALKVAGLNHPRELDTLAAKSGTTAERMTEMLVQIIEFPSDGQPKNLKSPTGYALTIFRNNRGKALASEAALTHVRKLVKDYEANGNAPPDQICSKCARSLDAAVDADSWYWDGAAGWLCPACEDK